MSGKQHPTKAFVAAAGLGKRMRPITATTPKPLIEVCGKSLIDHGLDALALAGTKLAVVNVHYIADLLEAHVCLLYTSPSPRDRQKSRMPSSA